MLSPHLDDGVFSLGAAISRATRSGTFVGLVTVFAGDPRADMHAGPWDQAAGFRSAGEAARARRQEDRAACRILGAVPAWLPFRDEQYGESDADDDAVWDALCPHLSGAGAVLVPGFPLRHADHLRLTAMVVSRAPPDIRIGLYAEQPYAAWAGPPAAPTLIIEENQRWRPMRSDAIDRRQKLRACMAYRSQIALILRRSPLLPMRVRSYERRAGGEPVAWVSSRNRHR